MPPPAVQPARVFEKVALVPGTASEEARRIDNGGVEAGEGDAAGAIDQGAVEGDADAAADRALDIALRAWP